MNDGFKGTVGETPSKISVLPQPGCSGRIHAETLPERHFRTWGPYGLLAQ